MKTEHFQMALLAAFSAAAVAADVSVPAAARSASGAAVADAMAQVKTTQWIEEAFPRKWAEISKDETSAADKAKALQEEAIKSGYYLTRIEEKDGRIVSKPGTFGEIAVKFKPSGTNSAETAEGRYFSAAQIKEKLAKHGGAGTLVPITGFANAVSSAAVEAQTEGLILGVGTKIFTIAGPVLLYGTAAAAVYGVILWLAG